jgi:hypothetical protein
MISFLSGFGAGHSARVLLRMGPMGPKVNSEENRQCEGRPSPIEQVKNGTPSAGTALR